MAVKNLEMMEEEGLSERSAGMGERLREELSDLEDHLRAGKIRDKGLLFDIEMVEDKETKQPAEAGAVAKVIAACKERGLIVGKNDATIPGSNNVLTFCPPLNITGEDLSLMAETLKGSFEQSETVETPVRLPVA